MHRMHSDTRSDRGQSDSTLEIRSDQASRLFNPEGFMKGVGFRHTHEFTGRFEQQALNDEIRGLVAAEELAVQLHAGYAQNTRLNSRSPGHAGGRQLANVLNPGWLDLDDQRSPAGFTKAFEVLLLSRMEQHSSRTTQFLLTAVNFAIRSVEDKTKQSSRVVVFGSVEPRRVSAFSEDIRTYDPGIHEAAVERAGCRVSVGHNS